MKTRFVAYILPLLLLPARMNAGSPKVMLSLDDCVNMAFQNDAGLKNARLDGLAAAEQKKEAFAEYFPTVSASAFGFYALDPMLEIGVKDILGENDLSNNIQNIVSQYAPLFGIDPVYSTLQYGFFATVSVVQPVYAGGRIVNGNRLASLGVEAADLQTGIRRRTTAEETEKSYWQVVSLEEKMLTLAQAETMLDTLLRDVGSAAGAGLATESDLMQVRLKRNELKNASIQVRNGIRLSKMNLFNTIGMAYSVVPGSSEEGRPYLDDVSLTDRLDSLEAPYGFYVPEEEIASGLDEARLLDLSVEAKRLERRMTLGEALPQIAVGASYGYSELVNQNFNGNVFAMVQIPISDWGKVSRKLKRQEYQIEKAANDREYLSSQLVLQVRQLWMNVTSAWDQIQVSSESVDLARNGMEISMANYNAGLIPLSELLQAQTAYRQACDTHTDRCIAYRQALTEYCGRIRTASAE